MYANGARHTFAAAWGHRAADLICVAIVGVVVEGLALPPGPVQFMVALSLAAFVVASWLLMRLHDRRLCEECVAALPLDATQRAARYGRRFALAHLGGNPRFALPYLTVLVASNWAPGIPGRVLWALAVLSMIYLVRAAVTHRRFQPWCPVCRSEGGGAEDPVNSDPRPDRSRQPV